MIRSMGATFQFLYHCEAWICAQHANYDLLCTVSLLPSSKTSWKQTPHKTALQGVSVIKINTLLPACSGSKPTTARLRDFVAIRKMSVPTNVIKKNRLHLVYCHCCVNRGGSVFTSHLDDQSMMILIPNYLFRKGAAAEEGFKGSLHELCTSFVS